MLPDLTAVPAVDQPSFLEIAGYAMDHGLILTTGFFGERELFVAPRPDGAWIAFWLPR